jgi:hypothetical protein
LDLLTKSRRETERVVRIFKKKRSFGAQVRQLSIPIDLLSDKLFSELTTIFPYVTRVSVDDEPNSHQDTITFGDRNSRGPMLKWKNTIEAYNLSQDWIGVLQVLETTTFPMLSELVLGHYFNFDDKEEGFDTTYFTQYIQHVPKLKNLVLHHCAIDTELLEKIHTSCLHLESLVLKNAVIMIKERELLQPIVPAYTVSSLSVRSTHLFDRNGVLLTYITNKYRHLRNLQLDFKRAFDIEDFQRYYRGSDIFTNENNDQDEADDEDEDGDEDGDGDGDDNDAMSVDTTDELSEGITKKNTYIY